MSGSTQPVAQTWRATEPRYPPLGVSYPVQIARPHTVRAAGAGFGALLCHPVPALLPFVLGVGAGVARCVRSGSGRLGRDAGPW